MVVFSDNLGVEGRFDSLATTCCWPYRPERVYCAGGDEATGATDRVVLAR